MVTLGADALWVEDSGGDGAPVVLLHPGIGDSRVWDEIWPELATRRRAARYDVRGYGRSPDATEPYSPLDDLVALLDHLGIERAHLVGCSMGGGTALDAAVLHPNRVASLVLLAPGIHGYPWPDEPAVDAEYERLDAAGDNDGLVAFAISIWAASGTDDLVTDLMRGAVRAWRNESEFQRDDEPTFDRLGEVSVPTVLMVGDRDNPPLVAADLAAAERIPGCRLVMMPGVDHLPMMREPRWVLDEILALSRD
jgi:pimeloyl-ACP methyl ester carboxylesterase